MVQNGNKEYSIPKWEVESISYHGHGQIIQTDKWSSQCIKRNSCESLNEGDVIGCLVSRFRLDKNSFLKIQYFKNGSKLRFHSYLEDSNYFPTIAMNSAGAKVEVNFGKTQFMFQGRSMQFFHSL